MKGRVFQFSLRPNEVHSSVWKFVYNYNQSSGPERNYLYILLIIGKYLKHFKYLIPNIVSLTQIWNSA